MDDHRAAGHLIFRADKDGITVFVRLTPKSAKDAVEGVGEGSDGRPHLLARVRAVPENGKANKALEKLLAKALGVAGGCVAVTGGTTSRLKQVKIEGDPAVLIGKLDALRMSAASSTARWVGKAKSPSRGRALSDQG